MEVGAHNSDYVVRMTIELDGLANNIRVGTESALPQAIAQDNDEVFAVHLFFDGEDPAEQGLALHNFEEAIANLDRGNSFGFAIARQGWVPTGIGRHVFKDTGLGTKVSYISCGNLVVIPSTGRSRLVAP